MSWIEEIAKDLYKDAFGIEVFPVTVDRAHQEENGITDRQPCQETVKDASEPLAKNERIFDEHALPFQYLV